MTEPIYNEPWMEHLTNGDVEKATAAAQAEDMGNPYRNMAKCVVMCDEAGIDLPQWCKDALIEWGRKEVGDTERYMRAM